MTEDANQHDSQPDDGAANIETKSINPQFTQPGQLFSPGLLPFQQHIQQVQVWQGQFPPPDAIERYVALQPDSFDRILRMAETQQAATIDLNRLAIKHQARDIGRGHYLGVLVTLAAIGSAIYTALHGQPLVAAVFLSVPVMTVCKSLVDSVTVQKQVALQPQPAPPPSNDQVPTPPSP